MFRFLKTTAAKLQKQYTLSFEWWKHRAEFHWNYSLTKRQTTKILWAKMLKFQITDINHFPIKWTEVWQQTTATIETTQKENKKWTSLFSHYSSATLCHLFLPKIMPRTSQKQREKVIELKLLNFTVCAKFPKKQKFKSQLFQEFLLFSSIYHQVGHNWHFLRLSNLSWSHLLKSWLCARYATHIFSIPDE